MPDVIDFRVHRFHPAGLDPVTVYVEQYGPASSRVTVQCYARAWTAYWGAHGKETTVEQFIVSCGSQYVTDNLTWGLNGLMVKRQEKSDYAYLIRIVLAMQEHFRSLKGGV